MRSCFFLLILSLIFTLASAQPSVPIVITSEQKENLRNYLPPPQITVKMIKLLTLEDAIALALRNNPNIVNSRFQRINDKYALELANYAYEPHFTFTANTTYTTDGKVGYNASPGLTWNTRYGTQFKLNNTTNLNGGQQDTFSVTQPLLRGFGAVNNFQWLNAQDQELIARQSFKTTIMTMVSDVITQYRQLVADYNNIKVQETALKREEATSQQYQLRVKSGKMAPSELLQEQATLANTRLQTEQQRNAAQQDYQTLLDTLGLSPTSQLKVNSDIRFKAFQLPSTEEAIQIALNNNPQYVSQKLQLNATRRSMLTAKDNLRWQLDLTGQANFLSASGNIPIIQGFDSLSTTTKPSVSLNLTIPIRDITSRAAYIGAQIAYAQALDNIEQSRRSLIRQVMNSITNLESQLKQLTIAEQSVELQKRNLIAEQIKQQYGQATALNVNIIQDNLLQQEINFINSQINYLNNVTSFQTLLGMTLKEWNVQLRY